MFPAALILTTVITIASILGVYKIFLEKPSLPANLPNNQIEISASPLDDSSIPDGSPQSTTNPKKPTSATSTSKQKPKSSPNSVIGSLTVLQNNTSSQTTTPLIGSSTISGSITLTGTPPPSSSIVIVAKESGTNNPSRVVADGITVANNSSWSWNGASSGVSYDLTAVIKGQSNGQNIDYAASQTYTVKAPAYSQVFSINAGYSLGAPSGTITISCNTHNSNNTWAATVNYPAVTGAQMYHFQIGSTSGGSDIVDSVKNAQTVDLTINDNTSYYTQYSVASVSNPTAFQYSSFSSPQTIRCP